MFSHYFFKIMCIFHYVVFKLPVFVSLYALPFVPFGKNIESQVLRIEAFRFGAKLLRALTAIE